MTLRILIRKVPPLFLLALFSVATAVLPASANTCSLADHIRSANTNTSVGGCPHGTSHDIITFTEDITLKEALPPIRGTITIEGNGHTISGDYKHRIFDVVGGRLTVNNLTLIRGRARGEEEDDWNWENCGGAIRLRSGEVTVKQSRFINNAAWHGGAISLANAASQKLTVIDSSFVGNQASRLGGAIMNESGTVSITNSSFSRNIQVHGARWDGSGGAIANLNAGQLDISNSTFSGNQAYRGGALSIRSARVTLTHLSFVDNLADTLEGHAIWNDPDLWGVNLAHRQINLRNSVISGGLPIGKSCYGPLDENIGNLIEDGSCAPMLSGEARLGQLFGAPAYHAPLDDSLTVDQADARFCLETDQIGTQRPQQGNCDIGAIESMTARPALLPPPSCSLSDEIIAANTDADAGGCLAGNGADTITLSRDIILREALPPITSDITIEGDGHAISGDRRNRIFAVDGGKLTLRDLTLTKGNGGSAGGAAWLENGAEFIVENSNFSENFAEYGGAIATGADDVKLKIQQSRFTQNTAGEDGGAIYIKGGSVDIRSSIFSGNSVVSAGRGYHLEGGAIAMLKGRLNASNSTFHDNRAIHGGAFYIEGGTSVLTHLTLVNNVSTFNGGDSIQQRGGSVMLRNSIVAGPGRGRACRGDFTELGGNFSEDGSCSPGYRGDIRLGEFTGSPAHFPLLDSSPAIDAADPRYCLGTDQIGRARPQGGGCDIGAIEFESTTAAPASPHPKLSTADCPLSDLIIAANADATVGNCPAGYLADTIALTANITLSAPLPPITSAISIEGNNYTISGNKRFRIFDVDGGQLHISRLTLRNGSAAGEDGGAIRLRNGAVLNGKDLNFFGNSAENGAAVAAFGSFVNIDQSQFRGNHALNLGAAAFLSGGNHSFHDLRARDNTAPGAPGPADSRLEWLLASDKMNYSMGYASLTTPVSA